MSQDSIKKDEVNCRNTFSVKQRRLFFESEIDASRNICSDKFSTITNDKSKLKLRESFKTNVKPKRLSSINNEIFNNHDAHIKVKSTPIKSCAIERNAISNIINYFNTEEPIYHDKQSKLLSTNVTIENVKRVDSSGLDTSNYCINVNKDGRSIKVDTSTSLKFNNPTVKNIIEKFNKVILDPQKETCEETQKSEQKNVSKITVDKCIEIRDGDSKDLNEHEYEILNLRTEVYFDQNSNQRIETTYNLDGVCRDSGYKSDDSHSKHTTQKTSQEYAIKELLDTESTYIENLQFIIENCSLFEDFIIAKDFSDVLSIIKQLHAQNEKFAEKLHLCNYDINKIISLIFDSEELFQLHIKYTRIYRTAMQENKIINWNKVIVRNGLNINMDALLLTPIQRLPRYKLLLENLKKFTMDEELSKNILLAASYLDNIIRTADTLQAVDSIIYCPFDLSKKGFLLRTNEFNVRKKYRAKVFLFEEIVLFTTEINIFCFHYRDSIDMNKLSIRNISTEKNLFHLTNFNECSKHGEENELHTFTLESEKPNVITSWVKDISDLLWKQFV